MFFKGVCALGGGFGNVLGPHAKTLSHSSVEYPRAASRDRQDGCHGISERATAKKTQWMEQCVARRGQRESEQGRGFFFQFSGDTPTSLKRVQARLRPIKL